MVANQWSLKLGWAPSASAASVRGVAVVLAVVLAAEAHLWSRLQGPSWWSWGQLLRENSLNLPFLPLQTSTWPLTHPNSPTILGTHCVRFHHGPTLPSPCPHSQWVHTAPVCLPLRPYSPQGLQASSSFLVLLKPLCLAGEGVLDLALSQESCGRP